MINSMLDSILDDILSAIFVHLCEQWRNWDQSLGKTLGMS